MKTRTTKQTTLLHWQSLPGTVNPLQHMEPIAYRSTGSKYGACGIRIDGTPEFIDAVLGKLKDLIDGENCLTRLELSRQEVTPTEINGETKTFDNAATRAQVCYIRLHKRGPEGARASAIFDKGLHAATKRFMQLQAK